MMREQQQPLFEVMQAVGQMPAKAYADDAGFDLVCSADYEVRPHAMGMIPLATRIKSAAGYWGLIVGRSSTFKRGLLVNPGIIDEGYTGPLFAVVHNMTSEPVYVRQGERIVQWIPMVTHLMAVAPVDRLPDTDRGSNGFGSSGA